MIAESLIQYYEALERIRKGRPNFVRKGEKITNDAVSLEAGRKKGSIKKSRESHRELIAAIDAAADEQAHPANDQTERLNKLKQTNKKLRKQLEASLARELTLLAQLFEAKKKIAKLTGENVLPILGKNKE